MNPIGIYIHIPFCKQKCYYCDFLSFAQREENIASYVKCLKQEIANTPCQAVVDTVFIGGGTPSLLSPKLCGEILDTIAKHFDLTADCEITIEANPGTLSEARIREYAKLPINRVSLGIQSFSDNLLKSIGRIHTAQEAMEEFDCLRQHGFANINVDLMFGLPGQTFEDWQDTLRTAVKMRPEHISCYSLIVEENTPFFEAVQKGVFQLYDEEAERGLYDLAKTVLSNAGYQQYEISNFALPDALCRHNIHYWKAEQYFGFGLGAHSYWNNTRYHNTCDLEYYLQNGGIVQQEEKELLTKEDQQAEFMFLGLRMLCGIEQTEFLERFGEHIDKVYGKQLEYLCNNGLLYKTPKGVALTARGIDVSNNVFTYFLPDR